MTQDVDRRKEEATCNYFSSVASGYASASLSLSPRRAPQLLSSLRSPKQLFILPFPTRLSSGPLNPGTGISSVSHTHFYISLLIEIPKYILAQKHLGSLSDRRIIDICKILQILSKLESVFLRILIRHRWG